MKTKEADKENDDKTKTTKKKPKMEDLKHILFNTDIFKNMWLICINYSNGAMNRR